MVVTLAPSGAPNQMIDRMEELKRLRPPPLTTLDPTQPSAFDHASKLEKGQAAGIVELQEDDEFEKLEMSDFFEKAKKLKANTNQIGKLRDELERLHKETMSGGQVSDDRAKQVEQVTIAVNRLITENRKLIEDLQRRNEELKPLAVRGSANLRIRQDNFRQLSQQFIRAAKALQKMQITHQKQLKDQVVRQYRIVNPQASDAEIKDLQRAGEENEPNIQQRIFKMAVREDARREHEKMKNRLDDMKTIEASLETLASLFVQMRDLVFSHQDIINRVGYNMEQVDDYTKKAEKSLTGAVESQKSIQRKKWIIMLAVALILLILIIVIWTLISRMTNRPYYY